MELRDKIREIAEKRGTTFSKIEKRCGIGNGSIAKWKDGRFPSAEILFRVSLFLETPMDEIMRATYEKGNLE